MKAIIIPGIGPGTLLGRPMQLPARKFLKGQKEANSDKKDGKGNVVGEQS